MEIFQTVILVIIAILLLLVLVILNTFTRQVVSIFQNLESKLKPSIENIEKASESLIPVIEMVNRNSSEISRVLTSLPEVVENSRVITCEIRPLAEEIGRQTPKLKESLLNLSNAAGYLKQQTDDLSEKMGPTVKRVSSVVSAFSEGFKIFQAYRKK